MQSRRRASPIPLLALLVAACREGPPPTATDDLGRDVALPARIERVVTLAPNLTEIVFAVGAEKKLVGTDDFSNYPQEARRLPRVGGMQPNVERIVALAPDVVLATTEGNHPALAPALAAAGVPLFVVRTDRLQEIAGAMKRVGELLDGTRTAAAVRALEEQLAAQRHAPRGVRVMFAIWTDPLYVGGRGTFTDDVLMLTGAANAVEVEGWPQYSLESLVASPPDLILYPRGAVTPAQVEALQRRVPEMKAEIIAVDEDIFQRPGPRVVEAARRLNGILDAYGR